MRGSNPRGGEALKSEGKEEGKVIGGKEEKEMGKTRAKVFSQGFFTEGKKRPFSLVKVSFCERKVLGGEKKKKMNANQTFKKSFTRARAKKYALTLPLVVVMAVLLAFSSPAAAEGIGGYAGNHPLTIYDHDTINGGLVFETVTDGSAYTPLQAKPPRGRPLPSLTQEITISIPDGATVKMARLYNYYCWSSSDNNDDNNPGMPAEADMWFNGVQKVCQHGLPDGLANRDLLPNPINSTSWSSYPEGVEHYWDTKGQNYASTIWDYPSGVFAWDVTDMVTGSGTYTAKIQNHDSTPTPGGGKPYAQWERFATFGFGLLVVYEHPDSPEREYGIAEGCDYLMASGWETFEDATTSATFGGVGGTTDVALTTVWTHTESGNSEDWDASQNMMYFNGEKIGPSTSVSDQGIGVNYFDVTSLIRSDENVLEFQDRNDDSCVHNAWLVVEKRMDICGDVNGDKNVDGSDVILLAGHVRYPALIEFAVHEWASDVNCDGSIDIGDVILLNNHVRNPALYPLNCCA